MKLKISRYSCKKIRNNINILFRGYSKQQKQILKTMKRKLNKKMKKSSQKKIQFFNSKNHCMKTKNKQKSIENNKNYLSNIVRN